MAVDTTAAAPATAILERLEETAWRIPLSTRRLLLAIAAAVVIAILAGSLTAAWVAARNRATIADARETGLEVASAATDLRTNLAAADAQAASTLLSGGLEAPETRSTYVSNLRAASQALTDAALVATADDHDDIQDLAVGLARYSGLVETARANSRQGLPVGAAYLNQARTLARDDLVPTADHLRRVGEQRVARAANSVGGPVGALAIVMLVLALAVLVASAAVVAGRSRRLTHPALLAAGVAAILALVVVTAGIVSQSRELRAAATSDIDAYVAANDAAVTVSNMRVTEISAVASHGSGAPLYDEVKTSASDLDARLRDDPAQADLRNAVDAYANAVEQVRATDLEQGNSQGAAQNTLFGASFEAFGAADSAATDTVDHAFADLSDRFDAASGAGIHPLVPIAVGLAAAGLAGAGTLARARRYR
jgi:hypothetical protein